MYSNKNDLKNQITMDVHKIKKIFYRYYISGKYEQALDMLAFFGNFMYQVNQEYYDLDAEKVLNNIAQRLPYSIETKERASKRVLFYDGFGIERRGLELIYIKALIQNHYDVVYVVPEKKISDIPLTVQLINQSNGKIIKMPMMKKLKQIEWLTELINSQSVSKFLLYILPNDVVPIVAAMLCAGKIERYQINLTDHAFWLGQNAFDYCIEFRDYGAYISREKRKININKIIKLPYYPDINKSVTFKGFPFEKKEYKVMFSGGSLYKTFGDNNLYYKLIKKILNREKNLIFLYAGQGDKSGLEDLKKDFPERVYWIEERDDLYQIMKHSDIYFSTYPMIGGLMSQYAIVAKKVPITLLYDDCGKGIILHQSKAFFEFKNQDKMLNFIHKLLNDTSYKEKCENELIGEIISIDDFNRGVRDILEEHKTKYKIEYAHIDTTNFQKTYIERLNTQEYFKLWTGKTINIFCHFPIRFSLGAICCIIKKLKGP